MAAGIPSNADRAALAQILAIINEGQDCQTALLAIQKTAITALTDPPPVGDYWERWLPAPAHINALPQPVRTYLHDLETNTDPAGMVAENALLRDLIGALEMLIQKLEGCARYAPS
jgi:hypothetical protein